MANQNPHKNAAAITGIGMITPLGVNTRECWINLLEGKSGIRRIDRFDTRNCLTQIGGQVPDHYFDIEQTFFSKKEMERYSFPSRMAIISGHQAILDADYPIHETDRIRKMAVISGSGGSIYSDNILFSKSHISGTTFWDSSPLDIHARNAAGWFGCQGPTFNVATACSSGAFALGAGFDQVCQNQCPCLVVGVDCTLLPEIFHGFNSLMALSTNNDNPGTASRPFDKSRNGFVMSEAACAILLEPLEFAVNRKSRIYALLSGYATTSEAYNIIAPEPTGLEMSRTMLLALNNAGVRREDVGYINAHGTSTQHNDIAETNGIKHTFGDNAYKIPVSSTKSMIGHSIGAAGAIEAAVTALSLYHQILTPTINLEHPDPKCDLDYIQNSSRKIEGLTTAISNSFGFGGHNCTLIFESISAIQPMINRGCHAFK
jgi:3-oxoacyl-[acyl-carrier-protein] synthase II